MHGVCRAYESDLELVQKHLRFFLGRPMSQADRCHKLMKLASAEHICQMMDEGCLPTGDVMWKSLLTSWMPHQQSPIEISKVLRRIQLSQMSSASLDELVQAITTWNPCTADVQAAQLEITLGCYNAQKLLSTPSSSDLQHWSGRSDGQMLPAPDHKFVWQVWPWSQLQHLDHSWSPLFRFAAGSMLWQLHLQPANDKNGHLGLWLSLSSDTANPHRLRFKLSFTGSSRRHSGAPLPTPFIISEAMSWPACPCSCVGKDLRLLLVAWHA